MQPRFPPRVFRRVPFSTEVLLRFAEFEEYVAEQSANISLGGMFVKSEAPAPPGTVLQIEFRLDDEGEPIRGRCRVAWLREEPEGPDRPAGMGLRFLDLNAGSREAIFRVVDRYVRGGGPFDMETDTEDPDLDSGPPPARPAAPAITAQAAPIPPRRPPAPPPASPPAASASQAPRPPAAPQTPVAPQPVAPPAPVVPASRPAPAAAPPSPPRPPAPAALRPLPPEAVELPFGEPLRPEPPRTPAPPPAAPAVAPPAASTLAPEEPPFVFASPEPEAPRADPPAPAPAEPPPFFDWDAVAPLPPPREPFTWERTSTLEEPASGEPEAAAPPRPAMPFAWEPEVSPPPPEPPPADEEVGEASVLVLPKLDETLGRLPPPASGFTPLAPPPPRPPRPVIEPYEPPGDETLAAARAHRLESRRRAIFITAAVVVIAGAAGGGYLWWSSRSAGITPVAHRPPPAAAAAPAPAEPPVRVPSGPVAEPDEARPGTAPAAAPATSTPAAAVPAPAAPEPALSPVRAVQRISWRTVGGATELTLEGDGRFSAEAVRRSRLGGANPRELLRVPGIAAVPPPPTVAVGTAQVVRVRSGHHPELSPPELHVVVDLAGPGVEVTSVESSGRSLVVRLEGR